jgi:EAL domain-containing protein (putative c-di-GMP-specific phosphodiesterase class I)
MLKFGTGTITAVAQDNGEGQLVRTAVALTEAERAEIIAEGQETESEGE